MTKKYKAKSHVSINVVTGKGNIHVSFTPLTGGGSVYYTDSEKIQEALERHPKYSKLFKLAEVEMVEPREETEDGADVVPPTTKSNVVTVPSLEDAKAYLVDNFGISRTKLRSKKQIEDAAAANGIEFNFE